MEGRSMILAYLAALTATPATLPATLRAAKCGDTVTLAAGDYGAINAPRLTCPTGNRLRIEAKDARMVTLVIRGVAGLSWRGGHVTGAEASPFAVTIDASRDVTFADALVTGSRVAVNAVRSTDLEITRNTLDGYRSDGINITQVQRVAITYNQMRNMKPIRASYSAAGKLLVDGDHADCVQGWTTPGTAPLADITIENNSCVGETQGFTFFNPGQGGYDRITMQHNFAQIEYWHAFTVMEGRKTVIRDNIALPMPGAKAQSYPFQAILPWVYTTGEAVACGNVVAAQASRYGTGACR
jgi:hypothetical protein